MPSALRTAPQHLTEESDPLIQILCFTPFAQLLTPARVQGTPSPEASSAFPDHQVQRVSAFPPQNAPNKYAERLRSMHAGKCDGAVHWNSKRVQRFSPQRSGCARVSLVARRPILRPGPCAAACAARGSRGRPNARRACSMHLHPMGDTSLILTRTSLFDQATTEILLWWALFLEEANTGLYDMQSSGLAGAYVSVHTSQLVIATEYIP